VKPHEVLEVYRREYFNRKKHIYYLRTKTQSETQKNIILNITKTETF